MVLANDRSWMAVGVLRAARDGRHSPRKCGGDDMSPPQRALNDSARAGSDLMHFDRVGTGGAKAEHHDHGVAFTQSLVANRFFDAGFQ